MAQTFVLSVCPAPYVKDSHDNFCDDWVTGRPYDLHNEDAGSNHVVVGVQATSKEALLESLYRNLLFAFTHNGQISFQGQVVEWIQVDWEEFEITVPDPLLRKAPYLQILQELFAGARYISTSDDEAVMPYAVWDAEETATFNHHIVLGDDDLWLDRTKLKALVLDSVHFYEVSNIADFA